MQKNNVVIVIPALNEPYLPKLLKNLEPYNVSVQSEKGLAYAVWKGIQNSKGKIIVVMDADGSHPPEAINTMVQMLSETVWFVVGSRYCKGAYSHDTTMRKIISLFYCLLARLLIAHKIHDAMSGFWLGYRSKFIFEPNGNYKFGLQLIKNYRLHIVEYPIVFDKRREGKSHVKPIQALKDLLGIFYIAKRNNKEMLCQK